MRRRCHRLVEVSLMLPLVAWSACAPPRLGSPCVLREGATLEEQAQSIRACSRGFVDLVVEPEDGSGQDLDVLFVIDNSTSMSPKQKALAQNIPQFIQQLDAAGVSYHVGIVTSDVGTLPPPNIPFPGANDPRCGTSSGDDGTLQRQPCTSRTVNVSQDASTACRSLCPDPSFVPSGGVGYISKVGEVTNVPVFIDSMTGKDVGPQRAFQCMAMVGDSGCGVESVFESAKRALDGHNAANDGFLRPGSLLAVIFITDEDDCSVQLSRRTENNPATVNCDPQAATDPSCFNLDYRCMARSVECDEPMSTEGIKTNCRERSDSYLEPVDKYVSFFRSLRPKQRLLVRGIWPPSIDQGGKLVVQFEHHSSGGTALLNRARNQDAACVNSEAPNIVGLAQLRLSHFLSRFPGSAEVSVCDTDRYADALNAIGTTIRSKLSARCLNLVASSDAPPACLVGEVDASTPSDVPTRAVPRCSQGCCEAWAWAETPNAKDPGIIAACQSSASPCFCTVAHDLCGSGMLGAVWRSPGSTPTPGSVVKFSCASQ